MKHDWQVGYKFGRKYVSILKSGGVTTNMENYSDSESDGSLSACDPGYRSGQTYPSNCRRWRNNNVSIKCFISELFLVGTG